MRLLSVTLLLALLLVVVAAASPAAACNTTYCTSRGNGTASASGMDGCDCVCEWPYFGYRCLYSFTGDQAGGVVIDCTKDSQLRANAVLCNSTKQCFWNTSESLCRSKIVPWYDNRTMSRLGDLSVPSCYRAISLPLQITVYSVACAAFGVSGIGFFYMLRFRKTYSVLDDTGERMFNQFYANPWVALLYCFCLFVSSGLLGVTAYINFRDPTVCVFLLFFYVYIIVQALAVLWIFKWIIEFCMMRFASPEKRVIEVDRFVRPTTREIQSERGRGCQLRCF